MTDLLLHPSSRHLIDAYLKKPAQSILLSGPLGIGTKTTAQYLAAGLRARHDDIHLILPDEKGTISIDRIRELYALTRTHYESARVIVIDDAESMSPAAQNALLKLLEEPTEQTYFILTSHRPQQLLATIRSRMQQIELRPINSQDSQKLLEQNKVMADAQKQMLFMAQGLPAELNRLSTDDNYFSKKVAFVTSARTLLQSRTYERLLAIKDIKDRDGALELVQTLGRLLEFTVLRQKRTDLAETLELIETVTDRLRANGNVKVQLVYLVTKLP